MAGDRAGNKLKRATELKLSNGRSRFKDQIGGRDRNDYLTFNLSSSSTARLSLKGLRADANLQLLGQDRRVIQTSARRGRRSESIQATLEQGNYYIRVYPGRGRSSTSYKLKLQYSPVPLPPPPPPPPDYAGNTLSTAREITVASAPQAVSDWVGDTDSQDFYRFSLGINSDFTLSLSNAGASLQLLNESGIAITTPNTNLQTSLTAGTYFVRVISTSAKGTAYSLNFSGTPQTSSVVALDGSVQTLNLTTTGSEAPIQITGNRSPVPASITNSLIGMDRFRADPRFADINGQGFTTVILDSGIDLNHPFFGADRDGNGIADRIVYQYDFADGDSNASDVGGHGSNVSSIVASEDVTYTGMAPGANIIHLKVFSEKVEGDKIITHGNFSYIEKALQWVVDNAAKYNIASVNLSLSDRPADVNNDGVKDSGNYTTPTLQQQYGINDELAALTQLGVIVVASAGNSFAAHNTPGVAYPAADPNALAVGAVWNSTYGQVSWKSGAIDFSTVPAQITSFSQRHSTLTDIFAPGAFITGADPTGNLITMGGTSQAAPHITGIAVLAQQLAVKELGRRLTPVEFRNLLASTGAVINDGDDENDNVNNTGADFRRVDMLALAEGILSLKPRPTVTIAATDASAAETASGQPINPGWFTLTRTGSTASALTVNYSTSGTAANGSDYSFLNSSVTFGVGASTATVFVNPVDDSIVESSETVTLALNTSSA